MKNYLLSLFGTSKMDERPTAKRRGLEKQTKERQKLIDSVHAAKEEWRVAQAYFENVSEPDLVDFSIYKLEAAKRKYMYLLKMARKEGAEDKRLLEINNKFVQS